MEQILGSVCAVVSAAALFAGASVAVCPARIAPERLAPWERNQLQALTNAACRCERSAGAEKAGCWTIFDKAMRQRTDPTNAMATACYPVGGGTVCMQGDPAQGNYYDGCQKLVFYVYKDAGQEKLCSPAATKIAERLWNRDVSPRSVIGRAGCASS